jgi:hypothetical protein
MGVKWFYVCREDDVGARIDMIGTMLTQEDFWIGFKSES